jgi:transcriptional regulator with XRE-family HTH domain
MNTPRVELLRLGLRLRNARTALGFNQRSFAAVCGLNHTYFGRVERGERNVTFSVLCTLCTPLGCDVAALTVGIPGLSATPFSRARRYHPKDPISRSAT